MLIDNHPYIVYIDWYFPQLLNLIHSPIKDLNEKKES